ncbi:zinc finger protein 260-like [Prorops nasuta]|uniref:zinc finger protein 260-like n=1 Tax=Prorops nasuta TaxID=863751 RepID=UPI0034CF9265
MFIVTKEIDSENISKLCRTCLREDGDKMICLFVGPAGSSLAAKLRSLSCLEVWQGDGLPEKMCDRCVTRAESALLYREQCRAADRALRQAALKVSNCTPYTTVSGCKLYQQNQGFIPVQNANKTLKCIECGAVFRNYQELCTHSRIHLPLMQETIPMQHMHIVDSQNAYFNFSHLGSNFTNDNVQASQISPIIRSNTMQMMPLSEESSNRAACALQCSLCNHTFTNRMQLITHSISHNTDNLELSSDNEHINISEISDQIPRDLSYDRSVEQLTENSIQNLSYHRQGEDSNEIQNLSFPENIDLDNVPSTNEVQEPTTLMHSSNNVFENCSRKPHFVDPISDKDSTNISNKHRCNLCSKTFAQKSKLLTHQLCHSDRQPFKCYHCEKAYASKSKLNAHVRLHTKTNIYECKVCDKVFSYPSYLEEHLKTHNKNDSITSGKQASFECATCKKQFCLIKNLKAHEKLHTGKGLLQCEICDKQFSQRYNLKMHLRMHKAVKSHKCGYCEKSFAQKGNLVEHLRIHTKVKPFECKLCHKRFSQSSHLKSHEISHASLRQHQCRLCGKRFKLANHLKRHMNLHTGSKAYKCDQCNQMFAQAFSLKRHLKRHNET